jgi:hypothetical protein
MATKEVLTDMRTRLEKASKAARESHKAWRLDVELRDELVRQAVDDGMHQRAVADACGFKSLNSVTQILAKPDEDD